MEVVEKKIVRLGNSQAVIIPKEMCDMMGVAIGDCVELSQNMSGAITIRRKAKPDQARVRSLTELFCGYDGGYEPHETDWGQPQGNETW